MASTISMMWSFWVRRGEGVSADFLEAGLVETGKYDIYEGTLK